MANSSSTGHHCKFNNNIVLMFQNVNVVKSAPFALLTIYQKSLYPPKVLKIAPFRQITRNSPTIFRFEQREMEPSNSTANCAKIAQFAAQTMNHAKSTQFLLNPTNPCSPTVPQPFYSKSREIRSIREYSERTT